MQLAKTILAWVLGLSALLFVALLMDDADQITQLKWTVLAAGTYVAWFLSKKMDHILKQQELILERLAKLERPSTHSDG